MTIKTPKEFCKLWKICAKFNRFKCFNENMDTENCDEYKKRNVKHEK